MPRQPGPSDDRRAKDLLRDDEVEVRPMLCQTTVLHLIGRKWWRPAGCSARFFKAMSADDPFIPPKEEEPVEAHRPVYVSQRFKLIDEHAEKKEKKQAFAQPKDSVPSWVRKLQELRDQAASQPKPQPKVEAKPSQPAAYKGPRELPKTVHTPAFGGRPDAPKRIRVGRTVQDPTGPTIEDQATEPAPPDANVDRRPPRIDGAAPEPAVRPMRRPPQGSSAAARRAPSAGDSNIDRTPPRIDPSQAAAKPTRRGPVRQPPGAKADVDRRPPKLEHTPTDARGEPLVMGVRRRQRRMAGGAANSEIDRTPPRLSLDDEAERAQPRRKVVVGGEPPGGWPPGHPDHRAPGSEEPAPDPATEPVAPREPPGEPPVRTVAKTGQGMDDLFGAPQEGRVRIGKRKNPVTSTEVSDNAAPEPTDAKPVIDRRPPRLASPTVDPRTGNHTWAETVDEPAPKAAPAPTPVAPGPAPELPQPAADAPTEKSEPRRTVRGPQGLDDLFGAAPEGRVRIGKRKKPPTTVESPDAAPSEAPAEPAVDRRPPKLASPTIDPRTGEHKWQEPAPQPAPPPPPPPQAKEPAPPPPPPPRPAEPEKTAPPRRTAKGPPSLDDLFGAAPEGRVRVGRVKKPTTTAADPSAPPTEAPAKPAVDRRPPRIASPTIDPRTGDHVWTPKEGEDKG